MRGRNRKWAAVTLAMTLVFASPTLAGADSAQTSVLTQDQAMKKVQQILSISDDYKLESVQSDDHFGMPGVNNSVWIFTWAKNNFADHASIHAIVNAKTGDIVSLNMWGDSSNGETKVTRDDARAKAKAWIQKLEPDKAALVQEISTDQEAVNMPYVKGMSGYSFRFVRTVNGIPFPMDGFTITIDGQGNLVNYNFTWSLSDDQFPKAESVIDKEKAATLYSAQLPLQLQYESVIQPGTSAPEMHLIYTSQVNQLPFFGAGGFPIMDAHTGKMITQSGEELQPSQPTVPLADKAEPAPANGNVDQETALKLAKGYASMIDSSYTLQNASFTTWQNNQIKVWRFSWMKGGDPKNGTIEIAVDANTGELRDLFTPGSPIDEKQTPKLSREEAREKAIAFVKQAAPTQLHSFALLNQEPAFTDIKGMNGYNFHFGHLVNGILSDDQTIDLTVDGQTGKVVQYHSMNRLPENQSVPYPDPKQAMSVEAAKAKILEKFPLQLQYVRLMEKNSESGNGPKWGNVLLVYAPAAADPASRLDAISGEWLTPWGQPADNRKVSDIKGHWAEKELQEMVNRGVFKLDGDKVHPDAVVTRGEAVRAFVLGLSFPRYAVAKSSYQDVLPTDPNYEFIESAVMMGWLPKNLQEFHPNEPILREELADLATHALGYGELSAKKEIFVKPFEDLTPQDDPYLGSIAIVKALGLMSGDGVHFHPVEKVTRAQIAYVVSQMQQHLKNSHPPYYAGLK
ncbi:hypothetical protein DNHGIG_11460 [Collibacillus ludicampi]|uniref:SLH domain-containing protein n=1 Tax=Collibacillus ludicampi TaxID=2771369 RepID=A0AAV4LDV1_9BACL|nr:YcdB/YcdC domain-containing protein [Collibacillus ludicampi]GIM45597.1 hypothetical protein DNHGIG_11460 [Collibacillus ludicampi]